VSWDAAEELLVDLVDAVFDDSPARAARLSELAARLGCTNPAAAATLNAAANDIVSKDQP
jgi:hypothetical protein